AGRPGLEERERGEGPPDIGGVKDEPAAEDVAHGSVRKSRSKSRRPVPVARNETQSPFISPAVRVMRHRGVTRTGAFAHGAKTPLSWSTWQVGVMSVRSWPVTLSRIPNSIVRAWFFLAPAGLARENPVFV